MKKNILKISRLPVTAIVFIVNAGRQVKGGLRIAVIISTLPIRYIIRLVFFQWFPAVDIVYFLLLADFNPQCLLYTEKNSSSNFTKLVHQD